MTDPISSFRVAEAALLGRYGAQSTERWLALASGARARVLESGSGPPTLFVHGGGAFGALWAPLAGALPARRALLLDRPGFGLGDPLPIGTSLRRHAVDFLVGVLDALAIPTIDIVANSMGGLWSLWLALERPERVRSLALLGAPALVAGGSAPLPMRLLGQPLVGPLMMRLEAPSEAQVRTLWRRMGHEPERLGAEVHDAMLAAELVPAYGPAWRALLGAALSISGPRAGAALGVDELARVRCPVAYVWGANDPFDGPERGRQIAAATRNASFVVAGVGHLPWLDDPAGCAAGCSHAAESAAQSASV